jgi:hypothetical protein
LAIFLDACPYVKLPSADFASVCLMCFDLGAIIRIQQHVSSVISEFGLAEFGIAA